MANVLMDIRLKRETIALRSWRNENFVVWGHYGTEPLMEVERAAVGQYLSKMSLWSNWVIMAK